MKICCFTGRRKLTAEQKETAAAALLYTVEYIISKGCTHFISGVANGTDLLAAQTVLEFQKTNKNLSLEAAVPYRNRLKTSSKKLQNIINHCKQVTVIAEKYDASCFMRRNKYMVDNSDVVVAVWDEQKSGGTYNTMLYAKSQGKRVITIHL